MVGRWCSRRRAADMTAGVWIVDNESSGLALTSELMAKGVELLGEEIDADRARSSNSGRAQC